jgi:serine protease Do
MYYSDYNRPSEGQEPIEATHFHVSQPEPPKKKRGGAAKLVALGLCCAIVGGLAGGAGVMAFQGGAGSTTTVYQGDRPPVVVDISNVTAQEPLTASQIYATYVGSTVGITVDTVTTNLWGQKIPAAAAGSGFVISEDGYIVTNYHVIEDATAIKVAFVDGTSYDATLVGGDQDNDIAVLKIEATGLTPVIIGDSDNLVVGEDVVAIGNPLGELTYTLTKGVVSAVNRSLTMSGGVVMNMIQTDTAINSGNSGGPLFNMYGQVVGITSAKLSNSSTSSDATIEGLGFAIPINDVWDMIQDIIENGRVTGKPYMGITPANVTESDAQKYGMSVGVYVNAVSAGSAAEKAGLVQGDIITAIDDTTITSYSDLKTALKNYKAGDTATLTLDRNGKVDTVSITFDEYPTDEELEQQQQQQEQQQEQQQQQEEQNNYYNWPFGGSWFPY